MAGGGGWAVGGFVRSVSPRQKRRRCDGSTIGGWVTNRRRFEPTCWAKQAFGIPPMRMRHIFSLREKACMPFTGIFTEGGTCIFPRQIRGDFLLRHDKLTLYKGCRISELRHSPSFPSLLLPFSFHKRRKRRF